MRISNIDAIALIDANNFYASCEQNINPHLRNKPVVILSNNDGCIIARSPEARALKIKMGTPYFKVKERLNNSRQEFKSQAREYYHCDDRRGIHNKRLSIKNNELYLKAENHNYPDFRFKNHLDVQIWGVVIYSIHSYL